LKRRSLRKLSLRFDVKAVVESILAWSDVEVEAIC
jgi:hypothetical protein